MALGTEEQIHNLKKDRGFTFVTANHNDKTKSSIGNVNDSRTINNNEVVKYNVRDKKQTLISLEKSIVTSEKNTQTGSVKIDAATQCDVNRDIQLPLTQKMEDKEQTNGNITKELLGTFLKQLMSQRPQIPVLESGTNFETKSTGTTSDNLQRAQSQTNVQLKKTSDLLHSLEKALSEDNSQNSKNHNSKKGNLIGLIYSILTHKNNQKETVLLIYKFTKFNICINFNLTSCRCVRCYWYFRKKNSTLLKNYTTQ